MAMRYLERELRETGNPRDGERANMIAVMRKARGKDIALPGLPPARKQSCY